MKLKPRKYESNVKNKQPERGSHAGDNYFKPGQVPVSGFSPVWCFEDTTEKRRSPTDRSGKKIY